MVFHENRGLVYFLVAQTIAIATMVISLVSYMVRLGNAVATLGGALAPHLAVIDNRLTVLESLTKANDERIDRVIDVMDEKAQRPIRNSEKGGPTGQPGFLF